MEAMLRSGWTESQAAFDIVRGGALVLVEIYGQGSIGNSDSHLGGALGRACVRHSSQRQKPDPADGAINEVGAVRLPSL